MSVEELIQAAIKSRKYCLGTRRTIKALKRGEAKAIVVASNCPEEFLRKIKELNSSNIPIHTFNGTNMELGAKFGKPFSVASLVILE